eukprot:366245-Chlamydomonas_euryale.AAC.31
MLPTACTNGLAAQPHRLLYPQHVHIANGRLQGKATCLPAHGHPLRIRGSDSSVLVASAAPHEAPQSQLHRMRPPRVCQSVQQPHAHTRCRRACCTKKPEAISHRKT